MFNFKFDMVSPLMCAMDFSKIAFLSIEIFLECGCIHYFTFWLIILFCLITVWYNDNNNKSYNIRYLFQVVLNY